MTYGYAHEYIHQSSIGNLSICKIIIQKINKKLSRLYQENEILGYRIILIEIQEDIEQNLIFTDLQKVTREKFPFVYSCVQPMKNNEFDVEILMTELGHVRIDNLELIEEL